MSKRLTRKSTNRLKGYDYSQSNWYHITTCTLDRKEWFGVIKNNQMILNSYGQICNQGIKNLTDYHKNVEIDTYIIMPNHVHVIIIINNIDKLFGNGQGLALSLQNKSLSKIICDFKSFSSREINKMICKDKPKACPIPFKWQRSFYDHIIRNEQSLNNIREYIINNPSGWAEDNENTNRKILVC